MKTSFSLMALVALLLAPVLRAETPGDYVAHEWGTFTSVQGADGIQLEWSPPLSFDRPGSDLPSFVYNPRRPESFDPGLMFLFLRKEFLAARQRMETPVIYFYADRPMTVDATVRFPEGLLTEWFPRAKFNLDRTEGISAQPRNTSLEWRGVEILPVAGNLEIESALPRQEDSNHYFAARATDSDFVRVAKSDDKAAEHEKFLFYRGVGYFSAPLNASLQGEWLRLHNTDSRPLRHLYVLRHRNGVGGLHAISGIAPNGQLNVDWSKVNASRPLSELREELWKGMVEGLVSEGLYEKEAESMVETWASSWFDEPGLRVFYMLPREWTDEVLPLELTPAPREIFRVMVGRAEVLTPDVEWALLRQIVRFAEGDAAEKAAATDQFRALALGRFVDPAVRRILGANPIPELGRHTSQFLHAVSPVAVAADPFGGSVLALPE